MKKRTIDLPLLLMPRNSFESDPAITSWMEGQWPETTMSEGNQLVELVLDLVGGKLTHLVVVQAGENISCLPAGEVPRDSLLLPGSFNPVHEGHEEIGRQAAKLLGRSFDSVFLELCVVNADKGAVDVATLCSRITKAALRGNRVLATRAMLFQDKADLFPGCDFVVGYDTYRRILNPKYYAPAGAKADSSPEEQCGWVAEALQRLQRRL